MKYNLITPEKTAISNGVSNTCKIITQDFTNNKESIEILDYGCGRLRNTAHLLKENFKVSVIDTPIQINKQTDKLNILNIDNIYTTDNIPNKKFDVILCSFVLNVIPEKKDRDQVLINILKLLNYDGTAYIEVRDDKFVKTLKNNIPYNDGLLTGSGISKTFQKPYTLNEFEDYLNEFSFNIKVLKKSSNSIIAVLNKKYMEE